MDRSTAIAVLAASVIVSGVLGALAAYVNRIAPPDSGRSVRGSSPARGLGEMVALRGKAACMLTTDGLDEIEKWLALGDMEEVARIVLRHGGTATIGPVKLLEAGFRSSRVRTTDGVECYIRTAMIQ